jgi:RAQPRD family integrative conjugative element protein
MHNIRWILPWIILSVTGCTSTDTDSVLPQQSDDPIYKVGLYQHQNAELIGVLPAGANAPTPLEREALHRFIVELEQLQLSTIAEAKANRRPDQRIPFNYDKLRKDITALKAGIKAYIKSPSTSPREKDELFSGDYR